MALLPRARALRLTEAPVQLAKAGATFGGTASPNSSRFFLEVSRYPSPRSRDLTKGSGLLGSFFLGCYHFSFPQPSPFRTGSSKKLHLPLKLNSAPLGGHQNSVNLCPPTTFQELPTMKLQPAMPQRPEQTSPTAGPLPDLPAPGVMTTSPATAPTVAPTEEAFPADRRFTDLISFGGAKREKRGVKGEKKGRKRMVRNSMVSDSLEACLFCFGSHQVFKGKCKCCRSCNTQKES